MRDKINNSTKQFVKVCTSKLNLIVKSSNLLFLISGNIFCIRSLFRETITNLLLDFCIYLIN
jgi:hypothetical protein